MTTQFTVSDRQSWMAILAKAAPSKLDELWSGFVGKPGFSTLREPETGLVMVRARAGGNGARFNMGEATVTRCSVVTQTGLTGHGYVLGRDGGHARAAAEIDASLQDADLYDELNRTVVEPLRTAQDEARNIHKGKISATRVDFFTLVRGEDE